MGVDIENKTVIFAQGFLSNEQSTSFDFANQFFIDVCGGHPKVGDFTVVLNVVRAKYGS